MHFITLIDSINWKDNIEAVLSLLPDNQRYIYFMELANKEFFVEYCITKKIPLTRILSTFNEAQIQAFFALIKDSKVTRLLTSRSLELDETKMQPLFIKIHRLAFVKTFIAIYNALWQGQSSFFKSDHWAHKTLQNKSYKAAMKLIFQHCQAGNRTEKALLLMQKHNMLNIHNKSLLYEIYLYTFSKSGLFKRSRRVSMFQTSYFHTSTRLEYFGIDHFDSEQGRFTDRRGKIFTAIHKIPSIEDCETFVTRLQY